MKVIFRDDDVEVSLNLPVINFRKTLAGNEELPRFFGLDPKEELLSGLVSELFISLCLMDPAKTGSGLCLSDRVHSLPRNFELSSKLMREIALMLIELPPGASVDFNETKNHKEE